MAFNHFPFKMKARIKHKEKITDLWENTKITLFIKSSFKSSSSFTLRVFYNLFLLFFMCL